MDLFTETAETIEREYAQLGHHLGWRFLYSPASTLSTNPRILFVGDNPGGSDFEAPVASVEEGNRRFKPWPRGKNGELNPLQKQVCELFRVVSKKLDHQTSWQDLMDETLTSNFCPFRSPSWPLNHRQEESMAFSFRLWTRMFQYISPSVLICMSRNPSHKYFRKVLNNKGYIETERPKEYPVDWGAYRYSQSRHRLGDEELLMIRLPHLSRFRIFGRSKSQRAVDQITDAIVESL